jgi:hypothetical protein
MSKQIRHRLRPAQGFAHYFHLGLVAVVPIIVYILVRIDLVNVAFAIILLSKWRIFAVRPRHWLAHIRTNAVDIIFSLSMLAFIATSESMFVQLVWVVLYEAWILFIKPGISKESVSVQALIATLVGTVAIFRAFPELPLGAYIIVMAGIAYTTARHFFNSFEEPNRQAYSLVWASFVATLTWLLGHWILFYGPVPQIAILTSVLGYGVATLYYLSDSDRLSTSLQRQIVFIVLVLVTVILTLSKWSVDVI